ncbi:replication initiator [Planobispora siamensis]|uniref:replication initiator n=1 Tax=Planobispora siamensis TaxID=936338 RepID=UPI00194FD4EA|nr:replication initiator [Planobispora siamensis]
MLRYAKAAEFQTRGLVHFHTLLRLDGCGPDDPEAIVPRRPRPPTRTWPTP